MIDCEALKTELDEARTLLKEMIAPGIRSVADSDGSRVEYTTGALTAQQKIVFGLQSLYDSTCMGPVRASGPFIPLF
jgi:hypothetical protein